MTDQPSPPQDFEKAPEKGVGTEIQKVDALISGARRLLAEGKMVDLGALEGKVRDLCRGVADGGGDAAALAAELSGIIERLDQLAAELTAQNREIVAAMGQDNTDRLRAGRAYPAPPGKDEKGE